MGSFGLEKSRPLVGCCEDGNEPSESFKDAVIFSEINYCCFLNRVSHSTVLCATVQQKYLAETLFDDLIANGVLRYRRMDIIHPCGPYCTLKTAFWESSIQLCHLPSYSDLRAVGKEFTSCCCPVEASEQN
jgi:hypothetical protein